MTEAVGRFLPGRMANGQLESLTQWRVTTRSPSVARSVSRLLGGALHAWAPSAEGCWEVATQAATVQVIVEGADCHSLDFRLATARDLGMFCFQSEGWELVEIMGDVAGLLARGGGKARCALSLASVLFTTRTGRSVMYAKPVLEVSSARG